jgi:peptidoglycan/LPS O-acetylase OafA/YrhL
VENYHEALFHTGDTFVSHTWSLAIEEQFYLLWPLFFWLFRKEYGRMIKFLSIVIGCVWIYRLILLFAVNAYQGYIYHAFEARMDHLLVGCLFAVLIRLGSIKKALYYICSRWYYPLVTIIIMCFSAGMHTNMIYKYSIGYALEPILIVALIAQMISLSGHSLWGKIVENPVMKYLGRISYPLYLYQQLTLFTTRRVAANLSKPIQFILACIVTIAIASASYFFIEKTFLKFKRPASREADHGMGRASGLAMQRTE